MNMRILVGLFTLLAIAAFAQERKHIADTEALDPAAELASFQVPEGFRVSLVAAEPDIQKPINLAFDRAGRLWVSGTVDYPYLAKAGEGHDSIRILADFDATGRAKKVTTFVDSISHPFGLLPYRDGVIAFVAPNIEFFRDRDGDGKAEHRELLYGPFDCSRDTHGLNNAFRLGHDGWVYACHGFNNQSKVKGRDGHEIHLASGNIYRFRPDGSRIEVFTSGQVNPFGLSFDSVGDLYSADCHSKPITLLLRGGFNPSFGRPHDGLGFVPEVMTHIHDSTGIAGVCAYTDRQFPPPFQGQLLLGNVLTNRINRDRVERTGSSVKVVAEPDLLVARDPWFRPVDLVLGPDGAVYVADFYNRIIGHYEVPLDHPQRDRHRGRIWRLAYVGTATPEPATASPAPSTESAAGAAAPTLATLLAELAEANEPRQRLLLEALLEQTKTPQDLAHIRLIAVGHGEPAVRALMRWVLLRTGSLTPGDLRRAMADPDAIVRIHAQRVLAEDAGAPIAEFTALAGAGLADADPLVQRAAATALLTRADLAHIPLLLAAGRQASDADPHLRHALKLALRAQLQDQAVLSRVVIDEYGGSDLERLAEAAMGVNSPTTTHLLLAAVESLPLSAATVEAWLRQAATLCPAASVERLVALARSRAPSPEGAFAILRAVQAGLRQQSAAIPESLNNWAHAVIQEQLGADALFEWTPVSGPASLWGLEKRRSADQDTALDFLSSLPGGEAKTGTLRSPTFTIPAELSFYLCGHLGKPPEASDDRNYVRLCRADTGAEVVRALPPRNDTAQRIAWDLSAHVGQVGYLELVDGVDRPAYAWLAVARFEPAVITVPSIDPRTATARLLEAVRLASEFHRVEFAQALQGLSGRLHLPREVRAEAMRTLASLLDLPELAAAAAVINDPGCPVEIAEQLLTLADGKNGAPADGKEATTRQAITAMVKPVPARLQLVAALALADNQRTAGELVHLMEGGQVPTALLQDRALRERLQAARLSEGEARLAALTKNLPDRDPKLAELLTKYSRPLPDHAADVGRGKAVFDKHCVACHSLAGVGKVIGPQLDGIGARGRERLVEDILDPNRNIDHAFRSRTYLLTSGAVVSGLFRREEGAVVILADAKGQEITVPAAEIDQQTEAAVSIMPSNWGELIPQPELADLLEYLLTKTQPLPAAMPAP